MALARMANEEQIRFVRQTQIEQERMKLTTAQGKRMVPIFLDLLNDVGDLEYVSGPFLLFLGFKFCQILALRSTTPSRTWAWTKTGSRCRP